MLVDDDILGNVYEAAGEITRVRGLQSGIRQTFTGAVRGDKVLLRRKPFAEIRANRHWDDAPGRISHETAHPSELRNGGEATLRRARGRHGGQVAIRVHVLPDGI